MKYTVNKKGFYGNFGGAFVPEMLFPNLDELEKNYNKIMNDSDFQAEYNNLLKDYVGRPTPLYFAESPCLKSLVDFTVCQLIKIQETIFIHQEASFIG